MKKSKEYEKGFKAGYKKSLDDNNILYGKDAQRIMDEVWNPRPPTKEQKKFFDDCIKSYKSIKRWKNDKMEDE